MLKFQDAETSRGVDFDVARFEPKLQTAGDESCDLMAVAELESFP